MLPIAATLKPTCDWACLIVGANGTIVQRREKPTREEAHMAKTTSRPHVRGEKYGSACGGTQWVIWIKGVVPEIAAERAEKGLIGKRTTKNPLT